MWLVGGMEALFLGAEFWIGFLVFHCHIYGFDCFGYFTKIQPIKERFTSPNHSINTIADSRDSQAGNTGWNCPQWGGEETSQSLLCKWQRTGQQQQRAPRRADGSLGSGWFQATRGAGAVGQSPALSSPSCPCQPQAGFGSTFSLWDGPGNDLVHLGHCWAQIQTQSCPQNTISGNWRVFLWALNKHDIVHVTKYVQ